MTPPAPPTEARLREAALAHLARYAATSAGLIRVLDRRVARWARAETMQGGAPPAAMLAEARAAVRAVVARLVEAGAVDDAAFAAARARRLARAGRSAVAIAAHLAARGVAAPDRPPPEGPEADLAAALVLLRRRRLGPFAAGAEGDRAKPLGVLARAGFGQDVAERALDCDAATAESLIIGFRRG